MQNKIMRTRAALTILVTLASLTISSVASAQEPEAGFISLFDGKSLKGWKKAEENPESWQVKEGQLVCEGERCHLFYDGELAPLKNFHFKAEVMTTPGSNAGIYFHTKYQPSGWPKYGYECQVNVTQKDTKKTSSLYAVENVDAATLAKHGIEDNKWYTQEIIVQGRHVKLLVNGNLLVDYMEPKEKAAFDKNFERRLGEGTFALQAHDPKSVVYFRNLRVKPLD